VDRVVVSIQNDTKEDKGCYEKWGPWYVWLVIIPYLLFKFLYYVVPCAFLLFIIYGWMSFLK